MAAELVKELIDAGIHFGHRVSRWNPKMKPYIFGKRNLIHIIDVRETVKGILLAKKFLMRAVAQGQDVLMVGTKRQARKPIEDGTARVNMHWVTERWLGGTLTNFHEIRKRVTRLEELEQMEADGALDTYSKKEGASLRREMRKILRNLGGIRRMTKLPGAMFVVDQKREMIAVREARKLKIPVICLLDTDSDPDLADIPIPGNDDAMRAISLVVDQLCNAIQEGMGARTELAEAADQAPQRRRSKRDTTARADELAEAAKAAPAAPAPAPAPTTVAPPPPPVATGPATVAPPPPPTAPPPSPPATPPAPAAPAPVAPARAPVEAPPEANPQDTAPPAPQPQQEPQQAPPAASEKAE